MDAAVNARLLLFSHVRSPLLLPQLTTLPFPSTPLSANTYHASRERPTPQVKLVQICHCLVHEESTGGDGSIVTIANEILHLLRQVGVDEQEAEALLRKHSQLEVTPLESLRRRLAILQCVGITGVELHSMVIKSPELLTTDEVEPLLNYVLDDLQELKPSKLQHFLSVADSETLSSFSKRIHLLLSHGVPLDKLGRFLNSVNLKKVFCDKTTENIEETILYLKRFNGFDWLLRRPQLLNLDLKRQLIPRVRYLTGLSGGDEKTTAVLISKFPYILAYSVEHYKGHLEFWRSIGLKDEDFFKVALVYPNIFSVSRERKLVPRIEFLQQCGLNSNEILKFLTKAPLFLSLSFEANLAKKLAFLVKIGYKQGTKELAAAMGSVTRTSCENMQMVIGVFLDWGFSCEDVMAMSKKQPQILQYNHKSLEKKVEYLVEEMDREIGELLAFPAFLGYKLDDRIKRRYEAKKEIRGKGLSINKLLSVSAERFLCEDEEVEGGRKERCEMLVNEEGRAKILC